MIIKVNIIEKKPQIDFNIYTESWLRVEDLGNEWLVEVTKRPEIVAKENEAIRASSQLVVAEKILKGEIPKERIKEFEAIFDCPEKEREYKKDWVLKDEKEGLVIVEKEGKYNIKNVRHATDSIRYKKEK